MDRDEFAPARALLAPRAVVFDLDGTLLDTERPFRRAFLDALDEVGWAMEASLYDRLIGLPSTTRRLLLPEMLGIDFPVERFFKSYYRHRAAALNGAMPLKPGVDAALNALAYRGVPCAVATSASARTAHAHLTAANLAHRFVTVVTRDDVARGKPAPDSFALAAARLGETPRDCLAVEDSAHGVRAAHAAGLMVAIVPDTVPPSAETLRLCIANLPSLHDLAAMLAAPMQPDRTNNRSQVRV